jgi:hypothetical protein
LNALFCVGTDSILGRVFVAAKIKTQVPLYCDLRFCAHLLHSLRDVCIFWSFSFVNSDQQVLELLLSDDQTPLFPWLYDELLQLRPLPDACFALSADRVLHRKQAG